MRRQPSGRYDVMDEYHKIELILSKAMYLQGAEDREKMLKEYQQGCRNGDLAGALGYGHNKIVIIKMGICQRIPCNQNE